LLWLAIVSEILFKLKVLLALGIAIPLQKISDYIRIGWNIRNMIQLSGNMSYLKKLNNVYSIVGIGE